MKVLKRTAHMAELVGESKQIMNYSATEWYLAMNEFYEETELQLARQCFTKRASTETSQTLSNNGFESRRYDCLPKLHPNHRNSEDRMFSVDSGEFAFVLLP